jgi:hypothetical protein
MSDAAASGAGRKSARGLSKAAAAAAAPAAAPAPEEPEPAREAPEPPPPEFDPSPWWGVVCWAQQAGFPWVSAGGKRGRAHAPARDTEGREQHCRKTNLT